MVFQRTASSLVGAAGTWDMTESMSPVRRCIGLVKGIEAHGPTPWAKARTQRPKVEFVGIDVQPAHTLQI